jgi:phospholipase C
MYAGWDMESTPTAKGRPTITQQSHNSDTVKPSHSDNEAQQNPTLKISSHVRDPQHESNAYIDAPTHRGDVGCPEHHELWQFGKVK